MKGWLSMPVAEPFIDSKSLIDVSPKASLARRLGMQIDRFMKERQSHQNVVIEYQKHMAAVDKKITDFQSEIDNCMSEEDVRKLCSKVGV